MTKEKINIQLLTTKEVMEKLQISRPTLYQLRKQGKINAVAFGDSVRFTENEIARFINESSETQTEKV